MAEISVWMTHDSPSGKEMVFGIDDDANLYVNGKRVLVDKGFQFQWWINWAIVLGGIGAFAQGVVTVYSFVCLASR